MQDIELAMRGLSCPIERTGSAVPKNNIALAPAMLTSAKALGRLVHQSFALLVVDVAHQMMRRGFQYIFGGSLGSRGRGQEQCFEVNQLNSLPRHNSPRTVQGVWNARHGCYSGGLLCAANSASTPHSRRNGVGKLWMDTGILCVFFLLLHFFFFFFFDDTSAEGTPLSLLSCLVRAFLRCVSIHVETSICWHLTR